MLTVPLGARWDVRGGPLQSWLYPPGWRPDGPPGQAVPICSAGSCGCPAPSILVLVSVSSCPRLGEALQQPPHPVAPEMGSRGEVCSGRRG